MMSNEDYSVLREIFNFGYWMLSYKFQVFGIECSWWDLLTACFFLMLLFFIIRRLASL